MKKTTIYLLILVIGLLSAAFMYFWPIEEIRWVQGFLSVYFVLLMWLFVTTLDRPRWYALSEIANMVGTLIVFAGSVFRPDTYVHLWPVFMAGLVYNAITAGIYNQFVRERPADQQATLSRRSVFLMLAAAGVILAIVGVERCTREQAKQTELLEEMAHPDSVKADPALMGEIKHVDTKVVAASRLDSLQTDSLLLLHSELLSQTKKNARAIAGSTVELKQLLTHSGHAETSPATVSVADSALTRRERRQLRRASVTPAVTHCDTLEADNTTLRRIVAVQERQLATRASEIAMLEHRGMLTDTTITDLEKRANTKLTTLTTENRSLKADNQSLRTTNQQVTAERDQLKGRTWVGRGLRKVRNVLAGTGGITLVVLTLKLLL